MLRGDRCCFAILFRLFGKARITQKNPPRQFRRQWCLIMNVDSVWAAGPEGRGLTAPGRKFRKWLICRQLGIQETKPVRELWEVSSHGGSLLRVKFMAPGQLPKVLLAYIWFCEFSEGLRWLGSHPGSQNARVLAQLST